MGNSQTLIDEGVDRLTANTQKVGVPEWWPKQGKDVVRVVYRAMKYNLSDCVDRYDWLSVKVNKVRRLRRGKFGQV